MSKWGSVRLYEVIMFGLRKAGIPWAIVLLSFVPAAHAQQRLVPGSTVRLFVEDEASPIQGVLESVTPTTWTLSLPNGQLMRIPPADVSAAQVRVTHRNTLRGALIGGGIGLIAGLLFVASSNDCDEDVTGICDVFLDVAKKVVLFGYPVLGAATGALIGTFVKTGSWVPAFVPDAATGSATLRWSVPVAF